MTTRSSSVGSSRRRSPRGSAGTRTPRSSPPTSSLGAAFDSNYSSTADNNDDNFHDNNLNGSGNNFDFDDDNDEMRELSPKHALRRGVSVGSNNSSGGGGLETLRAALGGLVVHDGHDEEMAELSPRTFKKIGGTMVNDADGVGSSLPHPEEMRSSASAADSGEAASGGSGNARVNALLACMCPFVRLADAARREGPAIFWRILPSILVTKAFWLSLLTLGLCDLATIVAVVDQDANSNHRQGGDDDVAVDDTLELSNDDGEAVKSTGIVSPSGDKDGDGMIRLTFGLWSYSTTPEDRSAGDDDVSFFEAEQERITTCTYHILAAEEGVVFFMDPIFRTARAFGIITVAVGFVTMVTLWTGVLKRGSSGSSRPERGRRKGHKKRGLKATVTIALILCSAFEGLTLLILNSGACGNKRMEQEYGQIYRDCEIAEGSSSPITAIVFWFLTGLAMLKFPADEPDDVPTPRGSTCEFGPDGREYGTGEEAAEDGVEPRIVKLRLRRPWWKRVFTLGGASPLHRADRQRVDGYTTELQFDESYEQDDDEEYETWRDNTMSLQMRELS